MGILQSMADCISYADITKEFDESLGFIRNDITALCNQQETVNYTVALLIGCACEALADGGAGNSKDRVFAEMLPEGDWRVLAKPLFDALRNGLAHSFDTKHLHMGADEIQIHISWNLTAIVEPTQDGLGILVGIRSLAARLCAKINEFQALLQEDEQARKKFRAALQRERKRKCSPLELAAWGRLVRHTATSGPARESPEKREP
jgi:hypothetical protein